ncbi:MAG: phosphoribosylformylglycinamidine synthase, partial [Gammaproteobacteria bacterium]
MYPSMLLLTGHSAFTHSQLTRLQQRLAKQVPEVQKVQAKWAYFLDAQSAVTAKQAEELTDLLNKPGQMDVEPASLEGALQFWVIPRIGTISPWSSKATQILQVCGWQDIKRVERGCVYYTQTSKSCSEKQIAALLPIVHDRMTQSVLFEAPTPELLFGHHPARPLAECPVLTAGREALEQANKNWGLALSAPEIDYLFSLFSELKRNPTDVELMMFAQMNSEHCRHKIFKSRWEIDGQSQTHSLFEMIQHTHQLNPQATLVAYADNAAVIQGQEGARFFADPETHHYQTWVEPIHIVAKVETHNHPTAIAPGPGAATGTGGEIRDEAATGRGAHTKAGLVGFAVSNLNIPGFTQPWEQAYGYPGNMASSFTIMLEAPLGAARFGNEFGRPNLCGYFRTYEETVDNVRRGFHKPIMLAGGLGNIRGQHVKKNILQPDMLLIVLGGPALLIGLGGGAASSMAASDNRIELDFASVQRDNPEMERRCQEVINTCWALDAKNPIVAIHDVGAGGLSNALPELLHDSGRGGVIDLHKIPTADPSLSPLELWCNEAQERYVLSIAPSDLPLFQQIAERERCPFAVVGVATASQQLIIEDDAKQNPIDLPLPALLGKMPELTRKVNSSSECAYEPILDNIELTQAIDRVLQLPTVADKTFLITIGDRTVGGMVARDQMIGPWQVPVADVAVTASSFNGFTGEAMALGERPPIALLDPAASARMAVGEAITNLIAADIVALDQVKLSANWMAACGYSAEDAGLYAAVHALAFDMCSELGISVPVGKDSLSMRAIWQEEGEEKAVVSPVSLNVTAFAAVKDIRRTLTPLLENSSHPTTLIFIDLAAGQQRLGGSALAQVFNTLGEVSPNVEHPQLLKNFVHALQKLRQQSLAQAYHDRSDGGLIVTLLEMAFASHCGLDIDITALGPQHLASLFNEELGAVIQIREQDIEQVQNILQQHALAYYPIAKINSSDTITIQYANAVIYQAERIDLQRKWSCTSYEMQKRRDNPECAEQQYNKLLDKNDTGLAVKLTFNMQDNIAAPYINTGAKPLVAILREQGVNSHLEMAAAFTHAGFDAVDVHMTDILSGRKNLTRFKGLAAGGGFSYGDVLGAGRGWATTILRNALASQVFADFFQRPDTFTLGICNGCQMMPYLRELIPGAQDWPYFIDNRSEQFEARLASVEILASPSIFLQGMQGSYLPVVVSHGEGFAQQKPNDKPMICARFIDSYGQPTEHFPDNPNGSIGGATGFTTADGRVTILMPHPERVVRVV